MQTSQPLEPVRLLTADEAAAQLRVSRFWVERAGRDGVLPRTLVGNKFVYPESGVLAHIAAHTTPAAPRTGRTARSAARARTATQRRAS